MVDGLRDKSKRGSGTLRADCFAGANEEEKAASLRSEDVTKLQQSDFFVSKLIVFSVSFGRKTKKSQPLGMTVFAAMVNRNDRFCCGVETVEMRTEDRR
jgi:hypothetical protein